VVRIQVSILFGKAKKLPNAPPTYVSLSPADVPKSFLADDGTELAP